MQKWEYKIIGRYREIGYDKNTVGLREGKDYPTYFNGKWQEIRMEDFCQSLGEDGWELVSVVAESNICGGKSFVNGKIWSKFINPAYDVSGEVSGESTDFAGFTNIEKWVFKRLKD